ncbi:MAG: YceD family protein [Cellvibrionaceae bacterium]
MSSTTSGATPNTGSSSAPTSALPRHLDPRKFAQQGVEISGDVSLESLERLQPLLATKGNRAQGNEGQIDKEKGDGESRESQISANLIFGIDEQGIRNVTGLVTANLEMVCQRCLEAATQALEVSINLGIVWSDEQAANLSKTWDPWILDEGQTDIYQMIEDELILGLPIVAYHSEECVAHSLYSTDTDIDSGENRTTADKENQSGVQETKQTEKPNPFQVLETLKGSLK